MNDPLRFGDQSCSIPLRAAGRRARSRNHIQLFLLAVAISAAAFLAPTEATARACRGNINIGCTTEGAVCSPVEVGIGPSGHCRTNHAPRGERECDCVGTPAPPAPDPCSDRTAMGKIECTINEPVVTQHETEYPTVVFAPGDIVDVKADGCIQTGGWGDTWKRYVNPTGDNTDRYYHGLIRIPTGTKDSALVRIETVIGRHLHVTGLGVPESQLVLHLGYEDDDYSDNGYSGHDDGSADQCKTSGPNDGGPAHVTITIFRGVPWEPPESRFDFDVLSDEVDPNGLPFNPQWSWQRRPENQGQVPNTSMCHEFSMRDILSGIMIVPNFPDCTDQTDLNGVDLPEGGNAGLCRWRRGGPLISGSFVGHVNWFPVTVEGAARWGDHESFPSGDDDYTYSFLFEDSNPRLSVNGRDSLHVEFDSNETVEHFASDEWVKLRAAVNGDDDDLKRRLFDGHTILTGMFGLDGEHDLKAELHPLYAMATRRDFGFDPKDDVWLMFVRNRGDEGFCSSQLWDAGFEDYTFRLPWLEGMIDVDVDWTKTKFEGSDGTSGPTVAKLRPPTKNAGVFVTFHLGPAASGPLIDGALHLTWTPEPRIGPPAIVTGPIARSEVGVEVDEAEHILKSAANQLTPAQRKEIEQARPRMRVRPNVHPLAPTGPIQRITEPPAIAISGLNAIKAGPATLKAEQYGAQWRALCAVTHNAPPGLPASICDGNRRDHP
jgi:hypothetical protein